MRGGAFAGSFYDGLRAGRGEWMIEPVGQNVNKAKTNVINHKIVADALSDD